MDSKAAHGIDGLRAKFQRMRRKAEIGRVIGGSGRRTARLSAGRSGRGIGLCRGGWHEPGGYG